MQKITPFLWFDNTAEEAMNYYISIFNNAKVTNVVRNEDDTYGPKGSLLTASFQLEGQDFHVLNGNPGFKLNESVSFFVSCETQDEIDRLWNKLTEGGEEQPCGWLKDKYGLSWQIVPSNLIKLLWNSENKSKAKAAQQAMMQMKKLDMQTIQDAYDNG
jgi:predicted 3-demethylubiquinone-9 3-methyltransferase (glyoxalase superfamily)